MDLKQQETTHAEESLLKRQADEKKMKEANKRIKKQGFKSRIVRYSSYPKVYS